MSNQTMSAQDIYDTILFQLRRQGGPSLSPAGNCAYRGENGRRCAAGWLLEDSWYSQALEGRGAVQHAVKDALVRSGVGTEYLGLVNLLQKAHDEAVFGDPDPGGTIGWPLGDGEWLPIWENNMVQLAEAVGLHYTPPGGQHEPAHD